MNEDIWSAIEALAGVATGDLGEDALKKARYRLSLALDRVVVGNLPSEDFSRLIGVLNQVSDKLQRHEQAASV